MSGGADDSSQRRWFRLHLTTALLLMLVAGVLIELNTRNEITAPNTSRLMGFYGYPFRFAVMATRPQPNAAAWYESLNTPGMFRVPRYGLSVRGYEVLKNAAVAVSGLLVLAVTTEVSIRWHAARRGRRRWYQLHPVACVVPLFALAGILMANVPVREWEVPFGRQLSRGYPYTVSVWYRANPDELLERFSVIGERKEHSATRTYVPLFHWRAVVLNAGFAIVAMTLAAAATEVILRGGAGFIRWRDAKRAAAIL